MAKTTRPRTAREAKQVQDRGNRALNQAVLKIHTAHLAALQLSDHYAAGMLAAAMKVLDNLRID